MICTRHGINSALAAILRSVSALVATFLLTSAPCFAQTQLATTFRFTISNQTKFVVDEVRLSPGGANNWGPDYTGNNVMKPGQAITIPDLVPGNYDVKFVDDNGHSCILKSIPVFSEMSWNITSAWIGSCADFGQARTDKSEAGFRITIKNNSRLSLIEVRASLGGANQWGPDRTGDSTLRPGDTFVLKELTAAQYDLKFVAENGNSCTLTGINATEQPSLNLTGQTLRGCGDTKTARGQPVLAPSESGFRLTVNNNSKYSVEEIRISPAGANKWGPDRRGESALKAGESLILKNFDSGEYDVKFVDGDGNPCVLKDLKIASHQSWNLTMQWLRSCEGFGRKR